MTEYGGIILECFRCILATDLDNVWDKRFWTAAQLVPGMTSWTWPDGTLVDNGPLAQLASSKYLYMDPTAYIVSDDTMHLFPRCQASKYYQQLHFPMDHMLKLMHRADLLFDATWYQLNNQLCALPALWSPEMRPVNVGHRLRSLIVARTRWMHQWWQGTKINR